LSLGILSVVLLGALLHASWNLLVKAAHDKQAATALVYITAGVLSGLALPFFPHPAPASWPYLLASTVTELLYGIILAAAYRIGDLSHAYPLMRGTAPLLVALASTLLVGEHLSRTVWAGVAILSGAIFFLVFDARARRHSGSATALAVLNAFIIATYTVIDGVGSRKSGDPVAYSLWLSLFIAVPWVGVACLGHRARRAESLRAELLPGIVGGACSLASYTLALWAMTRAPIAAVAAVRETSIVFGTLLGALVLRERVTWVRALSVAAIAASVWVIGS
jgi:drug/metabolite transporter (DMT)-like permease